MATIWQQDGIVYFGEQVGDPLFAVSGAELGAGEIMEMIGDYFPEVVAADAVAMARNAAFMLGAYDDFMFGEPEEEEGEDDAILGALIEVHEIALDLAETVRTLRDSVAE